MAGRDAGEDTRRVIRELLPPESLLAHEAMRELRPAYADAEAFVRRVDEVQRPGGYRLVAVLPEDGGPAEAVAGFRIGDNLAYGHHLYIDDLSTAAEARGRGHARALLDWLEEEARRHGCGEIHLDSGVGTHRLDAHRLYFNAGFRISSHHFVRDL